ncbi:MAG: transcription repressor NadR [Clostridia bacterium]|nr:transcription repressor NadR [Clostridia bacterium]
MPQRRRQAIINFLENATTPLKGSQLANMLKVSRQVIVQDIALLRAEGNNIIATPQGYLLVKNIINSPQKIVRIFACQHDYQGMKKELDIIVSQGGKVLDVIVEHPVYGELKGNLMLENAADVENFVESLNKTGAEPLSLLTKGIHLHTIEASSQVILDRIEKELKSAGFLL